MEKELIHNAIEAIEKCIKEYHDMKMALTLIKLCKYIAGDDFKVTIELD